MDKMRKQDGKSLDIVNENMDALKAIFPEAFTEDGVDFEVLRQLLGDAVDEGEEKYGLTWHGKKKARQIALMPSLGTLRPCPEESVDWDTTQNLFIEGDNLEVLKLLQKSYANKVKMIYIDPPYNTGKEFIYPDKFQDNLDTYLRYIGLKDEKGSATSSEVKMEKNALNSGRFHTNWLNMMYPRLKLARNLLREDGVIFISIDDNEVANLRKVCDEIFGEDNFEAQIIPISNPGGRDYKQVAVTNEYIITFAKYDNLELNEIPKETEFRFNDSDGGYNTRELRNRNPKFHSGNRPNLFYPFYINPYNCVDGYCSVSLKKDEQHTIEVKPYNSEGKESVWRWGAKKASHNIVLNDLDKSQIMAKQKNDGKWNVYEKNRRSTTKVKSVWGETEMRNEDGTRTVRELFSASYFDHPKSVDLIKRCIQIGSNEEDIVIDYFSGSCTTAHAVLDLNKQDGGNRKFIMVQLPEPCDENSEAFKAGYKTIAEIGKERIRRAAATIKEKNPDCGSDLGFKVFKLDSSNIRAWNPDRNDMEQTLIDHMEHLIEGRDEEDVLYELLLKRGVDLTVPIEGKTITGKTVYSIGYGVLFACLDTAISREEVEDLAMGIIDWHKELEPASDTQVVFRDSAFANDITKTNMTAILEQHGIAHVRSL